MAGAFFESAVREIAGNEIHFDIADIIHERGEFSRVFRRIVHIPKHHIFKREVMSSVSVLFQISNAEFFEAGEKIVERGRYDFLSFFGIRAVERNREARVRPFPIFEQALQNGNQSDG